MPKDLTGKYKCKSHYDVINDLKDILSKVHVVDFKGNPTEDAGDHDEVLEKIESMYADFDNGTEFLFDEVTARRFVRLRIQQQLFENEQLTDTYYEEEGEKMAREVFGHDEG